MSYWIILVSASLTFQIINCYKKHSKKTHTWMTVKILIIELKKGSDWLMVNKLKLNLKIKHKCTLTSL